jgi:hypothetical protein
MSLIKNYKVQNVLSKPSSSNALFFSYLEHDNRKEIICEGEAITYDTIYMEDYREQPEHIKTLCRNNVDTENTHVISINWFVI